MGHNFFDLKNKVIIITGGAGLLGQTHAEAVAEFGAIPVILDLNKESLDKVANQIETQYHIETPRFVVDITKEQQISYCCQKLSKQFGRIDGLINNAANNPKVDENNESMDFSRLEKFALNVWEQDMAVGLTGAFLCAKHFGFAISQNPNGGSIINISSDLGIIAPDQRLYREEGLPEDQQPVKPVSYSVIKSGLIGLTRYLATYWADKNVRSNALCPGGVYDNQTSNFVKKICSRIPLDRMAKPDEYQGAIVFLCSEASSYMNGAILSIDGGRSVW